ncbi:DUF4325 domain-containing protein [Ruminococcus sp. TF08-4]|nr:DUF4325 domain-containing protein [Ruminococcus sp. TF08-4]
MVSGQRLSYNVYGGDREGSCERIIFESHLISYYTKLKKVGGRMEEVKTIILKDVLPFVDPVARSHARRVLKDAEGYKELVIDFRGIEFMGRGFADEVFRVFQEEHPEITITPLHASTSMLAMIRHIGGKQQ